MDAIPFAATAPEQVVPLLQADSQFVAPYASRRAWSASIPADVLAAAGAAAAAANSSSPAAGGSSSSSTAEPADLFLRLRFCPTAVLPQPLAAGATTAPPNPFGPGSDKATSSSPGLSLGSGAPGAEAAASDGGGGSPCDAPVPLAPGATAAQCEAAKRLLQCSESLVFLTEFKDARLAPANVTAEVAPSGGGSPTTDGFAMALRSDAPALFVSLETPQAGRFNASALLLLPWQPQTVVFLPGEGTAAQAPPAPSAEAVDSSSGGPELAVYWLQQEVAALQPEAAAQAAPASLAWAARPPLLVLLALQLVPHALI